MRSKRILFCVVAAGLAGCSNGNSSPGTLAPFATPTPAAGGAATATPLPAATATPGNGGPATSTPVATTTPTTVMTPVGTVTPSPAPGSGTITSSSNPLVFPMNPAAGCGDTVDFSVSETGYSGAFTAASSNASFVTVTQSDSHDFAATEPTTAVPSTSTKVTVTISDAQGHTLVIPANFNEICL